MALLRRSAVMVVLLVSSLGLAQETFVGVGISLFTDFGTVVPLPSVHVGGEVAPGVVLRGSLDTLIIVSLLSADVSYRVPIGAAERLYLGGGLDLLLITFMGAGSAFGAHAVAGLEHVSGKIGVFGEAQPLLGFGGGFGVRLKGGVNFYF